MGAGWTTRVAACAVALTAFGSLARSEKARPHIVLIAVDDVGHNDHSIFNRDSDIQTPNLRRLAESGAVLENYYTQQVCSPTRSAWMTGYFPFRTGMQHTTTILPASTSHLPLDAETLPEGLRKNGYRTFMLGKWHLGMAKHKYTPYGRGFDQFYGYFQGMEDYWNKTVGLKGSVGIDWFENNRTLPVDASRYSLDQYMQRFDELVAHYAHYHDNEVDKAQHPLFAYYSFQSVHVPLQSRNGNETACKGISEKWRRLYCGMMTELDNAIGQAQKTLEKHALWENTLLILSSDNGGMVRFAPDPKTREPLAGSSAGSNFPLRGSKTSLFEGGVRTTAFITGGNNVWPQSARGTTYKGLMHAVDLHAIAKAAGTLSSSSSSSSTDQAAGRGIDGINLLPHIIGDTPRQEERKSIPININYNGQKQTAVRFGAWKLIVGNPVLVPNTDGYWPGQGQDPEPAPRDELFARYHLYNLDQDLEERVNMAKARPDKVQEGLQLIKQYMHSGYQPPQFNLLFLRGFPAFHGGYWAPFLRDNAPIREPKVATRLQTKQQNSPFECMVLQNESSLVASQRRLLDGNDCYQYYRLTADTRHMGLCL